MFVLKKLLLFHFFMTPFSYMYRDTTTSYSKSSCCSLCPEPLSQHCYPHHSSCSHTGESNVGVILWQGNYRTPCKVKGSRRAPHPTSTSTHWVWEATWDSMETYSSFLHLKNNPLTSSFLLGDWKVYSHTFLIIRT